MRNFSPRTVETYLSCLTSLSRYYNQSPDKISIEQVKAYLHYCITQRKASVSLINQTISAVKILRVGVLQLEWEPLKLIRPRREKKLPVILSPQETKSIIEVTKNIKHKAILMMGYSSGLRISEVINLRITDIDSKRMQVRIYLGKGKKDRYTLLSPTALDLLRIYYKTNLPNFWLFEGWERKQYSGTSIRKILSRSCKKAGIEKRVTYHSLRHCFATHLLEQGVSLQIIQKLLGHSSIKTTSVYLHVQQYSIDKVKSPIDYEGGTE